MLTPTIVKHWSDTKTIHVIGYFGGKEGDVYLQSEDGLFSGTKVSWPTEIKSSKPPLLLTANNGVTVNSTFFPYRKYLFYFQGDLILGDPGNTDGYITLFDNTPTELADELDISEKTSHFYAIFPKF